MSDPVIVEIVIAAPAETVWRALRDPAEIRAGSAGSTKGSRRRSAFIFFEASKADDDARVLDGGSGRRDRARGPRRSNPSCA